MRIEGDYEIIDTAEELACFGSYMDDYGDLCILSCTKYTRAEVLEAITPKEGDAVFWFERSQEKTGCPHYLDDTAGTYGFKTMKSWGAYEDRVKANALTIGKTVGELRELLAWAKGAE